MAKIYQFRRVTDDYTEYRVPGEGVTELCTIDGITYISVVGELPEHDPCLTVTETVLDDDLKGWIKAVSPHTILIAQRMQEKIRQQYTLEDEAYFSRIGVGVALGAYVFQAGEQEALLEFGAVVESVRLWGRDQRAELGL